MLPTGDSYKGGESYSDIRLARIVVMAYEYLKRTRRRGKQVVTSAADTLGYPTHKGVITVTPQLLAAKEAVVSALRVA